MILSCTAILLAFQDPSVQDLLDAYRRKIEAARTIRLDYEWTFRSEIRGISSTGHGSVRVGGRDRWAALYEGKPGGVGESYSVRCDGRKIVRRGPSKVRAETMKPEEVAAELRREIATALYSGLFQPVREGRPPKPPEAGPPKDLGMETLDGAQVRVIELAVKYDSGEGRTTEGTMKLFIEPARMIPRKVEGESEGFRWSQVVTAFATDEELPDSDFTFQSRRSLAEGRALQLARGVELFGRFTGASPGTLDDLLRRPARLDPAVFWPDGGFALASSLPKDPWGNPFALVKGKGVVSYGEDGQPGGSGEAQDIESPVADPPRQAVAAPTDRLRKHFTARVRIHLMAAAVRGFRHAYGESPGSAPRSGRSPTGPKYGPRAAGSPAAGCPSTRGASPTGSSPRRRSSASR